MTLLVIRSPDQHARADDQKRQVDDQPEEDGADGRSGLIVEGGGGGAFLRGGGRRRVVLLLGTHRPAHQRSQQDQQHDGIDPGQLAIPQLPDGQAGDEREHEQFLAQDLLQDGDRADEGGDAQDEGDVGDVGAVGIAQGDARVVLDGRECRDHQFRGGGAEADDQHADQHRGHLEVAGRSGGPVDEPVCAPDQHDEAAEDGKSCQDHALMTCSSRLARIR